MTTADENPLLFASTYQTGDYITLGAAMEAETEPAALERKRVGAFPPLFSRCLLPPRGLTCLASPHRHPSLHLHPA
jgi:hypothetical protein